ncbi:hypothetical protein PGT21_022426 [Puccinia graminis f. sp. tritici]|uniref:Uncharacterized protein n=1 Tax=Puccinia graminis f. sp. tritici TaxID=56615 RepID=A0A5B0QG06_PUCGR|nr:hypothetical protein PGT21_022426 [Puccinia graminis f. sp. tritici]
MTVQNWSLRHVSAPHHERSELVMKGNTYSPRCPALNGHRRNGHQQDYSFHLMAGSERLVNRKHTTDRSSKGGDWYALRWMTTNDRLRSMKAAVCMCTPFERRSDLDLGQLPSMAGSTSRKWTHLGDNLFAGLETASARKDWSPEVGPFRADAVLLVLGSPKPLGEVWAGGSDPSGTRCRSRICRVRISERRYPNPEARIGTLPRHIESLITEIAASVLSSPSAFPYNNSISPPSCTPPPLTGTMPPRPPKPPFRSSTPDVHQTATSLLIWIFRLRHLHSLKESNLKSDLTIFDDGL